MSTGVFLLLLVLAAVAAWIGMRLITQKVHPPKDETIQRVRKAAAELKQPVAEPIGQLDQLDTPPEGVSLAELLAARQGPLVPPEALQRRALRLQERHTKTKAPEPMRALAKLLIDTVDAGITDPYGFHEAARIFLACAPEPVLEEFAPEAEARFDALRPWLEIDLAMAALQSAGDRVKGPLDTLLTMAEYQREALHIARVDELLARIGHAAAQGQSAAGDALVLARYLCNRPALMPRAVSEMAMHPNDPVWTAAWLMLETRALLEGQLSNIPAFRSRVMRSLRSDDPALVAAAADATGQMLDAEAAGDLSVLWEAVGAALYRFTPPPGPLLALADRLGIARPASEA
jgi:hypothetical protein